MSGLLDVDQMRDMSNKARLETAFTVADTQLGIARSDHLTEILFFVFSTFFLLKMRKFCGSIANEDTLAEYKNREAECIRHLQEERREDSAHSVSKTKMLVGGILYLVRRCQTRKPSKPLQHGMENSV
jgi:hypothetical protein